MPFFSVVIPLYNKEKYILATLETVLFQTFTDFEVIIVNDGSTDTSLSIVQNIKDERIIVINQKNQGAAAARNKGIVSANSSLIVLMDADDSWMPNHLEELEQLFYDFPECGMYCNRYNTKISPSKIVSNTLSNSIPDNFRGVIPDFFEASLVNRVATSSSVMIPKSIFEDCGFFDVNISSGQDLDQWIRIATRHKVAISNQTTAIYNFEIPNSLSKTPFLEKRLIDFKKFEYQETQIKNLKNFLDLYRLEYAIKYRMEGAICQSKKLLNKISSKIPFKSKILLFLPPMVLKFLLKTKHVLRSKGIDFSIYH